MMEAMKMELSLKAPFAGVRSFKEKLRPLSWQPVYVAYAIKLFGSRSATASSACLALSTLSGTRAADGSVRARS